LGRPLCGEPPVRADIAEDHVGPDGPGQSERCPRGRHRRQAPPRPAVR
jgi:hypothetical protein